jgi:PEP-CTERM motif
MNKTFKTTVALGLALGAGVASAADSLSLQFQQTLGSPVVVSDASANGGAGLTTGGSAAGQMQFLAQGGGSFAAYCVEIQTGHANAAHGFQAYSLSSFSAPQAQLLQGLYSMFHAELSTDLDHAMFQTAIWEVVHEQTGSLDVRTGSLRFDFISESSTLEDDALFADIVNEWLQSAASYQGPALYTVKRYSSAQFQDMVLAQPVPEPGSYALMLGGLALVAWSKRRKA